jgi:hypothetical protein
MPLRGVLVGRRMRIVAIAVVAWLSALLAGLVLTNNASAAISK